MVSSTTELYTYSYSLCLRDALPSWLERRPGVAPGEVLAPADVEAAVRRLQRRYVQAAFAQHALPGTVGSELRPAASAESEDDGIGVHRGFEIGRARV